MADSPPWAVPQDVRDRWIGGTLDATDAQLLTLIADAEDTILREFPDLPDRIDSTDPEILDPIPLLRVKKVVARVVMRHLRNPEGLRQTQEGAGPYQRSTTYGGEEPGALYLTDEDRSELGGRLSGAAFTIDQTPAITPSSPETWLSYGGTYYL